jgi:outer membrane protein
MNLGRFLAAALLASLWPLSASAQQPAARMPGTLTLDDALRLARENNPAYRQTLNNLDVSAVSVRQAWANFLPSASASMGFSGSQSTTSRATGVFGETVTRQDTTIRNSSANQGLGLNLTLFDGGAMFRRYAAAKARERSTEADVSLALATLDAQVTRDFYEARRTAMLVAVELRNLNTARERYDQNVERFRLAAVDQVALLDAQRAVITAEQNLRNTEANAAKSLLTLRQTLGIESTVPVEVAEDEPPVFDPSGIDADALVASAVAQSPTVRQRMAALEAARQDASAARGGRWPTVSAGFNYSRSTSEREFGAVGELNPDGSRGFSFNMNVSLPLFNRFSTSMQVAQNDAAREDAEHALRSERLVVERTMRAGLIDLERAYIGFQTAEQIAVISRQQVELAEEQFRSGALDFLRFQQLVEADAQAQRQVVEARFAFVTARVALEEKLGAPIVR